MFMEKFVLLILLLLVAWWIIVIVKFIQLSKPEENGIQPVGTLKLTPAFICVMFGTIFTALLAVVMLL